VVSLEVYPRFASAGWERSSTLFKHDWRFGTDFDCIRNQNRAYFYCVVAPRRTAHALVLGEIVKLAHKVFSGGLMVLLSALSLNAGSIGPDCGTCFGGVYSLSGTLLEATGGQERWRIRYDLDLSGYTGPATHYVSSIAAKVVSDSGLISAATVSNPTAGTWKELQGGQANAGCKDTGSGWVCLQWLSGAKLAVGSNYSWIFDVNVTPGTLQTSNASIKANFNPSNGLILSETTTINVPEGVPGELPMLLSGLALFLIWRQRAAFGRKGEPV
jgi:hypothetical protein